MDWEETPSMPDTPLTVLGVLQLLYGAGCACMGLIMPLGGMVGAANDPDFAHVPYNGLVGGCMGCVASVFVGVFAAIFLTAGIGLLRGRKWGWIASLIGCGLWCTSCMMPVGALGFYALMRTEAREAYTARDPFDGLQ